MFLLRKDIGRSQPLLYLSLGKRGGRGCTKQKPPIKAPNKQVLLPVGPALAERDDRPNQSSKAQNPTRFCPVKERVTQPTCERTHMLLPVQPSRPKEKGCIGIANEGIKSRVKVNEKWRRRSHLPGELRGPTCPHQRICLRFMLSFELE
jgi:hypothetical protein